MEDNRKLAKEKLIGTIAKRFDGFSDYNEYCMEIPSLER